MKIWIIIWLIACNIILAVAGVAAWLAMGAWLPWLSFRRWHSTATMWFIYDRIWVAGRWTPLVKVRRRLGSPVITAGKGEIIG